MSISVKTIIHKQIVDFIQQDKSEISDFEKYKMAKNLLFQIDEMLINGIKE